MADSFDRIARTPLAGSDQASVSPGLRKWRSGSHNIYYRLIEGAVVIVRILHVRVDLARVRTTLQSPASAYRAEV